MRVHGRDALQRAVRVLQVQLRLDLPERAGGAEAQVVSEAVDEPRLEAVASVHVRVAGEALDGRGEAHLGVRETGREPGVHEVVEQVEFVQTELPGGEQRVEVVEASRGGVVVGTEGGPLLGRQRLVRDGVETQTAPRLGLDHGRVGVVEDGGEEGVGFGEIDQRHCVEHLADLEDELGGQREDQGGRTAGRRGRGGVGGGGEEGWQERGEREQGQHGGGQGGSWRQGRLWIGG